MKSAPVPVGARIVDSLPFSEGGTAALAAALKASGVEGVALYLGVAKPSLALACTAAGLGVIGVTLGDAFDGAATVTQAKAMLAPGTSVFLDVEGPTAMAMASGDLIAKINAWADPVLAAGFLAGIYVGVPQPLTSAELYGLRVVRYWHGQGSVRDRNNALAEPSCGWCMQQAWPSVTRGGVLVDCNQVGADFKTRVPSWTVA